VSSPGGSALKKEFADLRQRFDTFAARFVEKPGPRPERPTPPPPADTGYWVGVQELLTRGVTERGLRELIQQDTRDTVQFFTRELDLATLRPLPWYRRWPRTAWRVFLHTAFRLSPARRLVFALAVPLLLVAWVRYLTSGTSLWFESLLLSATLLLALLALELKDKLALKGDLEIARQIQFGLLPFEPVLRPGAFVCASMRPANTVGGDYFDVIELEQGRLAVAVADVAGKGMPAALLMALLQGSLRTLITAGLRGPELVAKLNDHLCANIPSNRLVTLFYAEFDPQTGELDWVNAGHNAPFLIRSGAGLERLPATGVALGVVPQAPFEQRRSRLQPGERLFLYTDGVTEAFDVRECEYGEDRLAVQLEAWRHMSDNALMDAVCQDVLGFCGPIRPRDDMTFMVLSHPPAPARPEPAGAPPGPVPLPRWS
jgi:serine phosphatase RsbU (regulator of sigma subunit)